MLSRTALAIVASAAVFCPAWNGTLSAQEPASIKLPDRGIYLGAYIDFGEREDRVTLDAINRFQDLIKRPLAIVASSSYWGEQSFPAKNLRVIDRYGAIPLVFWSPWDRPYEQKKGPDKFSLRDILAGKWDPYIDKWADQAKAFGKPILVSWSNEMNGDWFPWSGKFYGGSAPVEGSDPPTFQGPETFKQTYRHLVDRVRARGARNVLWVFHVNNYSEPVEGWNSAARYYPGPDYVDWIGMSVYGIQFRDAKWAKFRDLIDWPYEEISKIDQDKPIMVAEWGVGEFPDKGDKAGWLRDAFDAYASRYPRLKAAVYWHERWQNEDESFSNLRVNSSPAALQAFRAGVARDYWVDRPSK